MESLYYTGMSHVDHAFCRTIVSSFKNSTQATYLRSPSYFNSSHFLYCDSPKTNSYNNFNIYFSLVWDGLKIRNVM